MFTYTIRLFLLKQKRMQNLKVRKENTTRWVFSIVSYLLFYL